MTDDLYMVLGVILLGLALPAMVNAFSDGRPPRAAALLLVIGGALVGMAIYTRPSPWTLNDVLLSFIEVIAMVVR